MKVETIHTFPCTHRVINLLVFGVFVPCLSLVSMYRYSCLSEGRFLRALIFLLAFLKVMFPAVCHLLLPLSTTGHSSCIYPKPKMVNVVTNFLAPMGSCFLCSICSCLTEIQRRLQLHVQEASILVGKLCVSPCLLK